MDEWIVLVYRDLSSEAVSIVCSELMGWQGNQNKPMSQLLWYAVL